MSSKRRNALRLAGTGVRLAGGGNPSLALPFVDNFTRANGALGTPWSGATWSIASGVANNTPTEGTDVVVNGTFNADSSWTKGSGWSIADGKAIASSASASLTQPNLIAGRWYRLQFTVSNVNAGSWRPTLAGNATRFDGGGVTSIAGNGDVVALALSTLTYGVEAVSGLSAQVDNVTCKTLETASLFATLPASQSDVVAAVVPSTNTPSGVVTNVDNAGNPQNYVLAYTWRRAGTYLAVLVKCVNETCTQLISSTITPAAGATIQLKKSGETYQLFYNNSQVGTNQTISDVSVISNTIHGIFSAHPTVTLDNFSLTAA